MNVTVSQPPISLPVQLKVLNAIGALLKFIGQFRIEEEPYVYMDRARAETGLDDFGPFDVRTPLKRLLRMLRDEGDLHFFGRLAATTMIRRNLVNNLMVQQVFNASPEVADVDVESPIIILCSPRTGSTLLHNLLSQHPDARCPKMWELHRPCPAPKPELEMTDPRIKKSDREFGAYYRLIPEMRAIHYFAPEAVEECTHLFLNLFACKLSFTTMAGFTSYSDWISDYDVVPAYQAYKRQLQVLKLNYRNKLLILKGPGHLLNLAALEEVFPKARIVHLHRDPATAAGSFCSLSEAVQISMRKHVHRRAIGDVWNQMWTPALLNGIEYGQNGKLDRIDVQFRDLVAQPVETVMSIFQHFNVETPADMPSRVTGYLNAHPKGEYGAHSYSLERYGLSRSQIYNDARAYIEHFNLPLEG